MTLFRGYGSDLPLMEWLEEKIWPAEAKLTDDDVYWGTRLACVEMIRSGTVQFWDMYWHPLAVARAVRDAGMRATVGPPLIDGLDAAKSTAACAPVADALDELAGFGPMVRPSLAPHGMYTVSEASLAWVAEQSATRDIPVQIHFLETDDEVSGCLGRTGVRPGEYLDRIGLLSPRTVLAHGVWMDDTDMELLGARGATVVTNPVSNLKLAVGRVFPYARVREHGIAVGLGTDGASSNNGLDLLQDVKVLALVQKFAQDDPAALPAAEAFAVATGQLAPVLGARPLAVGEPADFVLVRAAAPELGPGHFLENLVYAASGAVVTTTVIAGNAVMRDGVVADEAEIRVKVVECARRLGVLLIGVSAKSDGVGRGEDGAQPRFEVLQRERVVVRVERDLVPLVGELLGEHVPLTARVLLARVRVHAEVLVVVAALEVLVHLDGPVDLGTHVRAQDLGRDTRVVHHADGLADVVTQRGHDQLVVGARALGERRRLARVRELVDGEAVGDLLEAAQEHEHTIGDPPLVREVVVHDHRPVLGGAFVHPGEAGGCRGGFRHAPIVPHNRVQLVLLPLRSIAERPSTGADDDEA